MNVTPLNHFRLPKSEEIGPKTFDELHTRDSNSDAARPQARPSSAHTLGLEHYCYRESLRMTAFLEPIARQAGALQRISCSDEAQHGEVLHRLVGDVCK